MEQTQLNTFSLGSVHSAEMNTPHLTFGSLEALFPENTSLGELCDYMYAELKLYNS